LLQSKACASTKLRRHADQEAPGENAVQQACRDVFF